MHPTAPLQRQQQERQERPAGDDAAADQPYQMVADQPTLILAPPTAPAMKPGKLTPHSADWRDRCRELAWAHGLVGMAQPLGRGQFGDVVWRVPSQSEPGTVHLVRQDKHDGTLRCHCPAGTYLQPCGHVGAVLFDGDTVEQLLDPREVAADETSAEYRAYFVWRTGIALARLERSGATTTTVCDE